MKKIPGGRKGASLAKRSGPDRKPVATIAAEKSVRTAIRYEWRKRGRGEDA
jgi:hypothetical protein